MSNRLQRVSVEGNFSDFLMVRSGVPHGSVLGPLLFILFTSDMWHNIESNMIAYADDTTLFAHVDRADSRTLVANQLNGDLGTISDWCSMWDMLLNPNKSNSLIVGRARNLNLPHPPLILNGSVI